MGTLPFIADYVVIAVGLAGLVMGLRARSSALRDPAALALYLAIGLLALAVPFTYRSPGDLLPLVACLPILAAPGVAALLDGDRVWLTKRIVPMLCLFGAASAAALGVWEAFVVAAQRAGGTNNPIHYAGIATILGYLALTGALSSTSRWRLVYLLGPALALASVVFSGSRGPLLTWAVLAALSLPVLIAGFRHRGLALATVAVAAAGVAIFAFVGQDTLVVRRIMRMVQHAVTSAGSGDLTAIFGNDPGRVAMYDAAWQAFLSSPMVGIGFGQVLPLARELYPGLAGLQTLEHLHSDIADFAAASGVLGLLALALMLGAPILLLRDHAARQRPELILGVVVLVVGYIVLGLTNAMFGVLPQTALYGLGLGYLMALARRANLRTAEPQESGQ